VKINYKKNHNFLGFCPTQMILVSNFLSILAGSDDINF
jgi:hypothetical protein